MTDLVTHVAESMYQRMEWKPLPSLDDELEADREFWIRDARVAVTATLDWIIAAVPFAEGECAAAWLLGLREGVRPR